MNLRITSVFPKTIIISYIPGELDVPTIAIRINLAISLNSLLCFNEKDFIVLFISSFFHFIFFKSFDKDLINSILSSFNKSLYSSLTSLTSLININFACS